MRADRQRPGRAGTPGPRTEDVSAWARPASAASSPRLHDAPGRGRGAGPGLRTLDTRQGRPPDMLRTPRPHDDRRRPGLAARAGVLGAMVAIVACSTAVAAPGPAHRWGVVPPRSGVLRVTANAPVTRAVVSNAVVSSNTLSFGGTLNGVGVVTGVPKVYLVFWGTQWGTPGAASVQGTGSYTSFSHDPSGVAPVLQAFFAGLGTHTDGWSGGLTQYCQSSATVTVSAGATSCAAGAAPVAAPIGGALAGVWEDTQQAAPVAATGAGLAAEAERAAGHFGNTTTAANRNVVYVVVSPTGTTPDGFNTPSGGFCAWHDDSADTATGTATTQTNGTVAFVNLPYLPDAGAGCGADAVNGAGGAADGVTIVAGHEYAEWLTDPIPGGGWYNTTSGSEIADECAWISLGQGAMADIVLATGAFPVQSDWSNANGACETTGIAFTTAAPTQTGAVGAPLTPVSESAVDPVSGRSLTYSAVGLPAGLSIDPATGQVTGTPAAVTASQPSVLTATDTRGISSSITVFWRITPAAALITTAPSSLVTLTYGQRLGEATLGPGVATVNGVPIPGSFAFATPAAVPGAGTSWQQVTFTPADSTNYATATVLVPVTVAKALVYVIPDPQTVISGQPEPNDAFTLRTILTDGASTVRLPTDPQFIAPVCRVAGVPEGAAPPTSPAAITCTGGTDANYTFDTTSVAQLTIVNAVNIRTASRVTSFQSAFATLGVVATDSERTQTLAFTAQGLPAGLAINRTTGRISGRVIAPPGTYRVRITATDTTGAQTTRTVIWIVRSPITLTRPGTQSSARHQAVSLQLRARDLIAHRALRFAAAGLPAGLRLNARTGAIRGTVLGSRRAYVVTIAVRDSGGARTTTSFTWRVR